MTSLQTHNISVLICNYNKENFILNTLNSLVAQTLKPSQIVIVDDASSDNSVELITAFSQHHACIDIVCLDQNIGLANARNIGIKHITGELIAFIDSDDLWHETKLEKQVGLLNSSKSDLVYNGYSTFNEQGQARHDHPKPFLRGDKVTSKLIEGNFIMGSSSAVLCKFDKVIEAGGFDSSLQDIAKSFAEDWDMWLRLSKICRFDYVNEPLTLLYSGGAYYKAPDDSAMAANRFKAHFWVRNKHWDDHALRQVILDKTREEWGQLSQSISTSLREDVLNWMSEINPNIVKEIVVC